MFLHLSTLPRSDFPVIHGARKHYQITDLFFFWACALQNSYFFMFSLTAYANLATNPKRLETKLANITRRHFCSLPLFCIEHFFICFLFSEFFPLICLFWHTLTARDNTRDRDANSSRQNDVTWCDFLQGKQVELSLPVRFCSFCRRKHRKSTARASRSWKKVTSTCRQVHGRGSSHKRIYKAPARRILAPFFSSELFFAAALSPDRDLLKL